MSILRKFAFLMVVLVMVMGLAACGANEPNEPNKPSEANEPNEPNKPSEANEPKLIVGTDTSFVPFEFLNLETNEYEGFDIDIWTAIAEELGVEFELKPMDFNGLIPALQAPTIDVALAGMTIKEERKEKVDFAIPYYDAGLLLLVRADNEDIKSVDDLTGKVVAVKTGTTGYNYAAEELKGKGLKEIKPFPNIDGAYMELMNNGADAVIFDAPNVMYFAANKGKDKVKPVGDILTGEQYGIAFPKGSELVNDVNAALETIFENGTYDALYEKWFGQKPPHKPGA